MAHKQRDAAMTNQPDVTTPAETDDALELVTAADNAVDRVVPGGIRT